MRALGKLSPFDLSFVSGALAARLEEIAAHVETGWEPSRMVREMDRCCERTFDDPSFDDDARARFAALATRLVGRTKLYVRSARLVEGSAAVDYGTAGIYDYDVRRWVRKTRAGAIDP